MVPEGDKPVTVAVQVVLPPMSIDEGLQETVVGLEELDCVPVVTVKLVAAQSAGPSSIMKS
jgi:hypothetical protein